MSAAANNIVPMTNVNALVSSPEQGAFLPTCRLPQKFIVFFPDIKFERTIFRLTRPFELTLQASDGGWLCTEEMFSLSGFGGTSVAAVCSVFEDFAVLWDEIAQAPDEELSDEAQRTKLTLLGFVKEVDHSA